MNIVCFHNPDEENGYLSNWYLSGFEVGNIRFSSMEQYMMYQKAVCFDDDEVAGKILMTDDVEHIKELGRLVTNFNENIWNGKRQIIVYEGLLAKFSQNETLCDRLKATGDSVLAELSMSDPKRLEMSQWRGQNLLGYALMMVRYKLSNI